MKTHLSSEEALHCVESGHRVFIHGAQATPLHLIRGLLENSGRLKDVEITHMHTLGSAEYAGEKYKGCFRVANIFVGANMRSKVDLDRVDYLPCFLSEVPQLFRSGRRPIDVALIHVSPPDPHGYCTLGTSVDVVQAAVQSAKIVVAQINRQMPRIHGDGFVHVRDIDHAIEIDEPLPTIEPKKLTAEEIQIGKVAATLIEDGATLQTGIGAIPDAVLMALEGHKNLGLHTEMWSDGALHLLKKGVINNSLKKTHRGKSVSSFLIGSKALYDFVHDNPAIIQLGMDYVNNPTIIARNPKVAAINSAVEIDLTGQVCADSIGHHVISGVGGQMDFIRGAALSVGGKPIIAVTSRTKKGTSRIVSQLRQGAGVVTTRAHVHFVVTEYGVADLYGKTLGERARELIAIAHPGDREELQRAWRLLRQY